MNMQPARIQNNPNLPLVLSSDALVGDRVVNLQGEDLGRVEELMIDVDEGRVSYAVVRLAGSHDEKLLAIPWSLLSVDAENRCFVINSERDTFANAPTFDRKNWSEMTSREWVDYLYRYYRQAPYWGESAGLTGAPV